MAQVPDVKMSCFPSISTHFKAALKLCLTKNSININEANELQGSFSCWALVPENGVIVRDFMCAAQVDITIWFYQPFSWSQKYLFFFTEVNSCEKIKIKTS